MLPYQTKYIENVKEIAAAYRLFGGSPEDENAASSIDEHIKKLRSENSSLLSEGLFPALDDLHNASEDTIKGLEEFAGALMDWQTNLDCGIYILIHDSLLRMYRFRKDRSNIIKELYMLGMGLYYQNRSIQGIDSEEVRNRHFRNEMVFTEAGSYLKFFPEISDEQTKGYIIRALANIAICSEDLKRRVAVSSRVLQIVQDDYYRSLAPSLPWDTFLERTHMQMSANRAVLSKGNLNSNELASVLESCEVVFKPQEGTEEPNIRWLWPYYEMEYTCGFVDLQTTLSRMRKLIDDTSFDQYDMSGLYGNVQLPIYYGRLMRENPNIADRHRHILFLDHAYSKMMKALTSLPASEYTDFFFYNICLVITDYYETEGVPSYRDITGELMKKLSGSQYIKAKNCAAVCKVISEAVSANDPGFFDDINEISSIKNSSDKLRAISDLAYGCGFYHDFGLIKMNLDRLLQTRELFKNEQKIFELHTISGHDDLAARTSTSAFADTALGHHRWYNSAGGYPESYVRNSSSYRQITDICAIASFLTDGAKEEFDAMLGEIFEQEGKRFSPLVTAYLGDKDLKEAIREIL